MTELLIAGGVLGVIAGAGALFSLVDWYYLFGGGLILMGLGFLIGVPTGAYYHVLLYRALSPRRALPRRWWLYPHTAHVLLTETEKKGVTRFFLAGAVGFGIVVLGCILFAVGALRS